MRRARSRDSAYFSRLAVVNGDGEAMVSAMVVQLEPAAEIV